MNDETRDEFVKLLGSLHIVHGDMANCRAHVDMPRLKENADEHLLSMHRLLDSTDTVPGVASSDIVDRLARLQNTADQILASVEPEASASPTSNGPADVVAISNGAALPDAEASPAGDAA